jgi:hypothetical protein
VPLDLLIPDLLLPADAPPPFRELRLPVLEKWLASAEVTRVQAGSARDFLANAFGLPQPAPVAPIALAGEGGAFEGSWLRADPVFVRIAPNGAALHSADGLDIQPGEAEMLATALSAHFAADGLEFRAAAPDRWYVRVPRGEVPATTPLDAAVGRNAFALMPAATPGINWPAVLTEAQMVLAAHDVNTRREREQRPTVNSVWLWGGGEAPASLKSPYAAIYAGEPFARGLGSLSGTPPSKVPADLGGVSAESALVVIDTLTRSARRGDAGKWREEANRLESAWFAGFGAALHRHRSVRAILPGPGFTLVATLRKPPLWHWIRKAEPLAAYA